MKDSIKHYLLMKDSIKDYLLKIGFKDTTSLDDFVIELINEGYEPYDGLEHYDAFHRRYPLIIR